jgi:hypothetical protein
MNSQHDVKMLDLFDRIGRLSSRLDRVESNGAASSSNGNQPIGAAPAPSPQKRGRFSPRGPSSSAEFPPTPAAQTPTDTKASNPACLRLRGFQYKLPKADMIEVATSMCLHLKIEHSIKEIHSAAIAGSCVLEFNSDMDARVGFLSAEKADTDWKDPATGQVTTLFLSRDESSDVRAMGSALHIVYDSVNQHIVPLGPSGTKIQTDRKQGLLQLVVNKRFYPIFQLETLNAGESFQFIERKGRWKSFVLPPFVTQDSLDAVRTDVSSSPLFD